MFSKSIQLPPRQVSPGSNVAYTVSAQGSNLRFRWDFGDGTQPVTTTNPNISRRFPQPGRFIVTLTVTDDAGQSSTIMFTQTIHAPLTANKPAVSQSVVYEARNNANDRIWNVNPDNDTVSVFDAVSNQKVREIAVGKNPRSIAIAPNGRIWVTNKKSATISNRQPGQLCGIDRQSAARLSATRPRLCSNRRKCVCRARRFRPAPEIEPNFWCSSLRRSDRA